MCQYTSVEVWAATTFVWAGYALCMNTERCVWVGWQRGVWCCVCGAFSGLRAPVQAREHDCRLPSHSRPVSRGERLRNHARGHVWVCARSRDTQVWRCGAVRIKG